MTFKDFNLKSEIFEAVEKAGFVEPSPVQVEAIPSILEGRDVVAQAHTGTGKTAAFGLPALSNLELNGEVEVLVVVPTRELAVQVSDEIFRFGRSLGIRTATIYGGTSYKRQLDHIKNASVVIGTPGRLLDLIKGKVTDPINISPTTLILDEADEMLDMGFLDDIKEIFSYMPSERQTLLFSATMPHEIRNLSEQFLENPKTISITKETVTNDNITQSYYVVEERERDEALVRLIDYKNPTKSIIFCRTKREVDRVAGILNSQGFSAKALHGDIEQRVREAVIRDFKSKDGEILIATDVASRGLDVSDVTHVFNYHIPFDSESYVHRIGRTGRAGREGFAVSIITPQEFRGLQKIERSIGAKLITKVVPNISKVREKKMESFVNRVTETEVSEDGTTLISMLENDFDDKTILYKLASIIAEDYKIRGSDMIGKTLEDIERIKKYSSGGDRRGGGRGGRGGYRGGRGGYRGGDRRDGGGYRGGNRRDRGDRDGGGYRGGNRRDRGDRDWDNNRGSRKRDRKYSEGY
jgi:ATP-dependent RNA helicase DeaD